jgi:hypothetical protein
MKEIWKVSINRLNTPRGAFLSISQSCRSAKSVACSNRMLGRYSTRANVFDHGGVVEVQTERPRRQGERRYFDRIALHAP